MINEQTAPVNWYLLLCELEDAQDGLKSLMQDIAENKEFSETEFSIYMRHIYGHLNRAWNSHDITEELSQNNELWDRCNRFPVDTEPF